MQFLKRVECYDMRGIPVLHPRTGAVGVRLELKRSQREHDATGNQARVFLRPPSNEPVVGNARSALNREQTLLVAHGGRPETARAPSTPSACHASMRTSRPTPSRHVEVCGTFVSASTQRCSRLSSSTSLSVVRHVVPNSFPSSLLHSRLHLRPPPATVRGSSRCRCGVAPVSILRC